MYKSIIEKKIKILLIILFVCVSFVIIFLFIKEKGTKYRHVDKEYFTMTSKVELPDLPWTIISEDAKKVIGELDTTYDVEMKDGNEVLERLMPLKQIFIDDLDRSTDAIRLMFNQKDELISIDFYFECESYEEGDKLYDFFYEYLSEQISMHISKVDKNDGTGVTWIDDEGNSLSMIKSSSTGAISNFNFELNFLSADHRTIYSNE